MHGNMLKYLLVTHCILLLIVLVTCIPHKMRHGQDILRFDSRLGVPIATSTYIEKFEKEHRMMYKNENGTIDEVKYLQWKSELALKSPTDYCRKYLKSIVPKRDITGVFGEPDIAWLLYLYDKEHSERQVAIIKCQLPLNESRLFPKSYFIADAPHNCLYPIIRAKKGKGPFKIVSQVCDFENDSSPDFIYTRKNLKNNTGGISRTHRKSGVPIACGDRIEEYEYQHQNMHTNKYGTIDADKYLAWPENQEENYVMVVCSRYVKVVAPVRARDISGMMFKAETGNVIYIQKNTELTLMTGVIHCQLPPNGYRSVQLHYYITEAPNQNCVFSLIRVTRRPVFKIVFEVCGITREMDSSGMDVVVAEKCEHKNPPENVWKESDSKPEFKNTAAPSEELIQGI